MSKTFYPKTGLYKKLSRNNDNINIRSFYNKTEGSEYFHFQQISEPNLLYSSSNLPKFNNYYSYSKIFPTSKKPSFRAKIKILKENKKSLDIDILNRFHHIMIHSKFKNDKNTIFSSIKTQDDSNSKNISISKNNNFINNTESLVKSRNFSFKKNMRYHSDILQLNNFKNKGIKKLKNNINSSKNLYLHNNYRNYIKPNKTSITNTISSTKSKNFISLKTFSEITEPVLNYKFNNCIGNFTDNNLSFKPDVALFRGANAGLIDQIISKFRLGIANKIKLDYYQKEYDLNQKPYYLLNDYYSFQKKNELYYKEIVTLIKKYMMYLYGKTEEEKLKLYLLMNNCEKIKDEIIALTKKIDAGNEKVMFYQGFMKLLLKIKFNKSSLNDIPHSELKKYGIIKKKQYVYNESGNKSNWKKTVPPSNKNYATFLLTSVETGNNNMNIEDPKIKKKTFEKKKTVPVSLTSNALSNTLKNFNNEKNSITTEKSTNKNTKSTNNDNKISVNNNRRIIKTPIFNNAEEFLDRMKGIEIHNEDLFKSYEKLQYQIKLLQLEKKKEMERLERDKTYTINDENFLTLKTELEKLENTNSIYQKMLKYLKTNNDNVIEESQNKNDKKSYNGKFHNSLYKKLVEILTNLDIDVEQTTGYIGFYDFINNPNETKINYEGKEYLKIIFCLKVLETLLLKLFEQRDEILNDKNERQIYLKVQGIITEERKMWKMKEKKNEKIQKMLKKQKLIMEKNTKIPVLPYRKNDPYSNNIMLDKIMKLEKEKQKRLNKKVNEETLYKNFISY